MVSFDPAVAVTPPDEWERLAQWEQVPAVGELPDELVVFSAHPDDETLGVGGLLARAATQGRAVRVVVATADDPARLAELDAALDVLGIRAPEDGAPRVSTLGLPDGALKHHTGALRAGIDAALAASRPGTRLVVAPWTGDRHGDHRTLGREVTAAARDRGESVLHYPVWLWQWGTPADMPWSRLREVVLSPADRERKREALRRFASQLRTAGNPAGVLEAGFVERAAAGREVLIEPPPPLDEHFDRLHREAEDPWHVRTRWYERRRRQVLAASLPRERYAQGLELGCSVGETTAVLADRCDALLAVDGSAAAVETAGRRLRDAPQVTVEQLRLPEQWPDVSADLIVVSEIAYYFDPETWDAVIDRIRTSLRPDGEVLLCHWTGEADDFAQSGATAHERFRTRTGMRPVIGHHDEAFALEVFR